MSNKDTNPRGQRRPQDGRGGGKGMPGGLRKGKNTEPCSDESGPGSSKGSGRGKGTRRKK